VSTEDKSAEKTGLAIAVGIGGVVLVSAAAFFLGRDGKMRFDAIVDPPEVRVATLRKRIAELKAGIAHQETSPEAAKAMVRLVQNLESTLALEEAKIPKLSSEEQKQKDLKAWQEKNRQVLQRAMRQTAWERLGKPARLKEKARKEAEDIAAGQKAQRRERAETESELERIRRLATEEEKAKKAERLENLYRQEELLSATRIAPPTYVGTPFELDALIKLRDTSFEIPDEPRWLAVIETLKRKNLLVEKPDPLDPEFSFYELTREGKKLMPGSRLREQCSLRVSPGALPHAITDFYQAEGFDICGTSSFLTEDGRQAYAIKSIRLGPSGPMLHTERWSKHDDTWSMDDARHQEIDPKEFEASRLPVRAPMHETEYTRVLEAEEAARQHEERLQVETRRFLETQGVTRLPEQTISAELERLRSLVHVPRGGGSSFSPVQDERLTGDFDVLVKGVLGMTPKTVRIKYHEDDHEKVRQILRHNPPSKASVEDVSRQLQVIGADFARSPTGKAGYENVYRHAKVRQ